MSKSFLAYVLLNIAMLIIFSQQSEQKKFTLQKTIQLPISFIPSSYAIRSDDDIFVIEQSQQNSTQFTIYTDPTFKTVLKNYNYTQKGVNSIGYSDSGIYTVENKVIQKYPFIGNTEINLTLQIGNMVTIDQKTKVCSVYNDTTKCPTIRVIKPFLNQTYDILYQTQPMYCNLDNNSASLKDLQNGMLALRTSKVIYIISKSNLLHVITKVNVSSDYSPSFYINGIGSYYDKQTNLSMISLQSNPVNLIYVFDHEKQTFNYTGQFDNFGTSCKFYDANTCITFINNKLVRINNFHYQKVNHSYIYANINPFQNISLIAVSNDSLRLAGYDSQQMKIVIYNVSTQNTFQFIKNISLSNQIFKCITEIEFVRNDNQLLIQANNCKNDSSNLINICKINIQLSTSNCLPSTNTTNTSSISIIHSLLDKQVTRFITIQWTYNTNTIILRCLLTEDNLKNDTEKQVKFQQTDKIINVKLLYKSNLRQRFALLVSTSQSATTTRLFQLFNDGKSVTIKQLLQKRQTNLIPLQSSVIFNNHIVSLVTYKTYKCVLQFYDWDLKQVSDNSTIFSEDYCSNISHNYRLITQQKFNYLIVQRLFRTSGGQIIDLYNIKSQQLDMKLTITKRILFSYYEYDYQPMVPFAIPSQNTIITYISKGQPFGIQAPITIYNMSVVHFSAQLQYSFSQLSYYARDSDFLAYSTPFTNKKSEDQILSYSWFNSLYTIRNPTQQLISLQQKQTPTNYIVSMQKHTFYQNQSDKFTYIDKQLSFIQNIRTYLASTGQHIISVMGKNISTQYNNDGPKQWILVVTEICSKHKGIPIWEIIQDYKLIHGADISTNGYAFILKNDSFKIRPFFYNDSTQQYSHSGTSSIFQTIQVTNDDQLFYTLKQSKDTLTYALYRDSQMNIDYQYINQPEKFAKIQSIKLPPSGNAFLLETQKEILVVYKDQNRTQRTQRIGKSQGFINMHILENDEQNTKSPSSNNIMSSPQTQTTIILRYSNYTMLYSSDLKSYHKLTEIAANTIFAVSERGSLISYVQKLQNLTEVIHVMRIYSYGDRQAVDSFVLPSVKTINSNGQLYTGTIKDISFSSLNTLCVLTTYSSSEQVVEQLSLTINNNKHISNNNNNNQAEQQQKYPPILYMYSQQGCNISNSYIDNNLCKCLENFTEKYYASKYSKVIEITSCQCENNFVLNQQQTCLCPTWQGFTYDSGSKLCNCDDGYIEDAEDGRNVKVCTKYANLLWLWICIGLLGVYAIGCYVSHKVWKSRYQRDWQRYFQTIQERPPYCFYVTCWPCYKCFVLCRKNLLRPSLLEQRENLLLRQ